MKFHRKVFNQRNNFLHKLFRGLVNNYGLIFVKHLNVFVQGCDCRTKVLPSRCSWDRVARVEHQTSSGFRVVTTFASIVDWLPHETKRTEPSAANRGAGMLGRSLRLQPGEQVTFWLYGETKFRYQGYGATGTMPENPISIRKINGPRPKSFRIRAAGNPTLSARKIIS